MEIKYIILMIFASFVASVGQILLKKSVEKKWNNKIREYVNALVIGAYLMIVASMFINIYAYRGVAYQVGIILGSLGYVFIVILGKVVMKEKINKGKIIGSFLIVLGMIVYSFGF